MLKYEFELEFEVNHISVPSFFCALTKQKQNKNQQNLKIPAAYPAAPPEIKLPKLDGKTAKMYRGGIICTTDHFVPLWQRNAPKFGLAHALALGVPSLFFSSLSRVKFLNISFFLRISLPFPPVGTMARSGGPRPGLKAADCARGIVPQCSCFLSFSKV